MAGTTPRPQQARQHVAAPADFLAQREERADDQARQYFENCKARRSGDLRSYEDGKASEGQNHEPCEMDDGGPTDGQRPAFQPGAVKAKQRQGFAQAAFRRNQQQHDQRCHSWCQHGDGQAGLADPRHGEGHSHGKRQRDCVKDTGLA